MTQEETMKVWADLSARVMYHPKIRVTNTYLNQTYDDVLTMANFTQYAEVKYEVKPYLRPMSSMTKAEIEELKELTGTDAVKPYGFSYSGLIGECFGMMYDDCSTIVDYLNAHNLDYRGLLSMGLAFDHKEEIRKTV